MCKGRYVGSVGAYFLRVVDEVVWETVVQWRHAIEMFPQVLKAGVLCCNMVPEVMGYKWR